MADLKENQMKTGAPAYLRGVASNGDGLKVTVEQARSFFGVYKTGYSLQAGEELDLGQLGYGRYLLACPTTGFTAGYTIGSYPVNSDNPILFGDYADNVNSQILFGRKETNGNFFLKNNSDKEKEVRILQISI